MKFKIKHPTQPKNLVNYSGLSRLFNGNRNTLKLNQHSKAQEEAVCDLKQVIEQWKNKWFEQ